MVWEKISGVGVIIPPITKEATIITLRYFARKAELIIPSLAKINNPKGKLKMMPNGRMNEIKNDNYAPTTTSATAYPYRSRERT